MFTCQLLVTIRRRDERGRLVRHAVESKLSFPTPHVSLRDLRREATEAIKGLGLTHACDQVDIYAGGSVVDSLRPLRLVRSLTR